MLRGEFRLQLQPKIERKIGFRTQYLTIHQITKIRDFSVTSTTFFEIFHVFSAPPLFSNPRSLLKRSATGCLTKFKFENKGLLKDFLTMFLTIFLTVSSPFFLFSSSIAYFSIFKGPFSEINDFQGLKGLSGQIKDLEMTC